MADNFDKELSKMDRIELYCKNCTEMMIQHYQEHNKKYVHKATDIVKVHFHTHKRGESMWVQLVRDELPLQLKFHGILLNNPIEYIEFEKDDMVFFSRLDIMDRYVDQKRFMKWSYLHPYFPPPHTIKRVKL